MDCSPGLPPRACSFFELHATELALWTDRRGEFGDYPERPLSGVEYIVIHHTAGGERDFTAEEIADYHVRVLGWPGLGYHFLIHWDGRVEYVGDIRQARYHAGALNERSVGVCFVSDWTHRVPPKPMLESGARLVRWLRGETGAQVVGHRDVAPHLTQRGSTSCPGETWSLWRGELFAQQEERR